MLDEEIASLLEDAGYVFNANSGRYEVDGTEADESRLDYSSEEIADQLELPLEDLLRWETEQTP